MYLFGSHIDFRMEGPGWLCFGCRTCKSSVKLLLPVLATSWPWPFCTFCPEKTVIHKPSQLWPTPNASNTVEVLSLHYMSGRNVEHRWWKMSCCFWIFTVTNTCHTVWLCHQDTRQTAVCDTQGENTWRELGRYGEILHFLSFLLIDGELPVMTQSLMS